MLIDTQLHILDPQRFAYAVEDAGYIPATCETGDLAALTAVLEQYGVDRGILVQPSGYGLNNDAMLHACAHAGGRLRGVAMADLSGLEVLARHESIAGIRLNMTDYARHDGAAAQQLGSSVLQCGLVLQVQGLPAQLGSLLPALPPGPVVLDHLGRPDTGNHGDFRDLAALADRPATYLKVSGGFRLAPDWRSLKEELRNLVSDWPQDRIVWGSDWPFINAPFGRPAYGEMLEWAAELTDLDRASDCAAALFGFAPDA